MALKHPKPQAKDITRVISLGGNQCAFDGCTRPIFSLDQDELVGTIAHIKARSYKGPRFDINQTPDENRSADNLMPMCKEHGKVIDAPENIATYTVGRLQQMKRDHELKMDRRADRSWISNGQAMIRFAPDEDGEMQQITLNYWEDRHGNTQIMTPRQTEINALLLSLYMDINALCQLQEMTKNNPEAQGKDLLQSYATMKIDGVDPATGEPWTPVAHILRKMAKMPEITFGEFTKKLLSPESNPTDLFVAMEKELKSKPDPE